MGGSSLLLSRRSERFPRCQPPPCSRSPMLASAPAPDGAPGLVPQVRRALSATSGTEQDGHGLPSGHMTLISPFLSGSLFYPQLTQDSDHVGVSRENAGPTSCGGHQHPHKQVRPFSNTSTPTAFLTVSAETLPKCPLVRGILTPTWELFDTVGSAAGEFRCILPNCPLNTCCQQDASVSFSLLCS